LYRESLSDQNTNGKPKPRVTFTDQEGKSIEVDVSNEVLAELNELQKEYWRLEKREQRHSFHLDTLPEHYQPRELHEPSPEQLLMEQIESTEIVQAIRQLRPKAQRRFLMQAFFGLSVKKIAFIEGCSESSVKASLAQAKEKLKKILTE